MPIAATKRAAALAHRRLRRTCEEVRSDWTARERRRRRIEAFQMQMRLARLMGLQPAPIAVRAPNAARPR
ncbi:hypothetical protein [Botrimarina sp.]|uniref:hypothetical protein n=1 Tax=Botrimarina sp. TaxID=2795802 RepID=UPI0032ED5123